MSDSDSIMSRDSLLRELDSTWNELQTYLASLTEEQLTRPTDAAGWTAKDHVIHIAMWEKGTLALLEKKLKREVMDIPLEVWEQDDDPTNALIQQRYREMPLDEVMHMLRQNHELLLKKLDSMSEDELRLPYHHYQPGASNDNPLIRLLPYDTIYHYRDHMPWIAAIVEKA